MLSQNALIISCQCQSLHDPIILVIVKHLLGRLHRQETNELRHSLRLNREAYHATIKCGSVSLKHHTPNNFQNYTHIHENLVWGLGLEVYGLGFMVWGLRVGASGLGFRVLVFGFMV